MPIPSLHISHLPRRPPALRPLALRPLALRPLALWPFGSLALGSLQFEHMLAPPVAEERKKGMAYIYWGLHPLYSLGHLFPHPKTCGSSRL